jgi:hypothetical protein
MGSMSSTGRSPERAPQRCLHPTAAIKIIEQVPVEPEAHERAHIEALARELRAVEPALRRAGTFGPRVASGCLPAPSVVVEDHSAITLFERTGDLAYSYRSLLLAGPGDLVIIGIPPDEAFENYCRDCLGLGRVEILRAEPGRPGRALMLRAAEDRALVARLASIARSAGGLNLVPYMGTGGAWKLAMRIAEEAGQPVRVAAGLPELVRRVNEKSWFAERVTELLGPRASPPAVTAHGFAALAARIKGFAKRHPSIAVKLPSSASSAGNLILDSSEMARLDLRRTAEAVRGRLKAMGWSGAFPLLVTAWERPIFASPSLQLWVPKPADGTPIVEGIFDQATTGATAIFSGAAPSALAEAWQLRAAREAARLATLFQALGYFGRCSFDAVLVGDDEKSAELHWVECNGRWGGVSIPMTLTNRLSGDWTLTPPVIFERAGLDGRPRAFDDLLKALSDDLYRSGSRPRGLIVLSPGRIEAGAGYEAMILETSVAAGLKRAGRIEERLLETMRVQGAGAS